MANVTTPDVIKVLQEIRGTSVPGELMTDGIYHDLTIKDTDDDGITPRLGAGLYGSIQEMYTGVNEVLGLKNEIVTLAGIEAEISSLYTYKAALDSLYADKDTLDSLVADKATIDAVNANSANIDTVADNDSNITTVATDIANVNTVAANILDVNNFADTYHGALAVAPTIGTHPALSVGDMYYDTVLDELRVYDNGDVWKNSGSTVNGTSRRESFESGTASGVYDGVSLTVYPVNGGYDAGYADVYLNGVKLLNGTDVDVSSGTNVVLASEAISGDIIDVVAYGIFVLADHYTKAEQDIIDGLQDTAIGTKAPMASPALTGTPTAPTPTAGDNSTKLATTAFVESATAQLANSISIPAGTMIEFAGTVAPTGYLVMDGSELSETTYADLFAAIGTAWNTTGGVAAPAVGNFRLPPSQIGNLGLYKRGVGATNGPVGTYQADVFKSHLHEVYNDGYDRGSAETGSYTAGGPNESAKTTAVWPTGETGDATETRPRSITVLMCIKY